MAFIEADMPRGIVRISDDPTQWPRKDGDSGFVPVWAVIPDPDQPRQYFDPVKLAELGGSIRANGQREIAKVAVLSEKEQKENALPDGRLPVYRIVSGERRWRACGLQYANLAFFEARVASYVDAEEQFEDAFLLNESREGAPPLDIARSLKRLLSNRCDNNVAELCRKTGKNRNYVENYLALLDLVPEAMQEMFPNRPEKTALPLGTAMRLSKLKPERQRLLIGPIMKGEAGKTSVDQKRWIDEWIIHHSGHANDRAVHLVKTSHAKERLINLAMAVRSRILSVLVIGPNEFASACQAMSKEQLDQIEHDLTEAQSGIGILLDKIRKNKAAKSDVADRVTAILSGWIKTDYYENGVRQRDMAISPKRYKALYALGLLGFQKDGIPRPAHLPDPAELEEEKV